LSLSWCCCVGSSRLSWHWRQCGRRLKSRKNKSVTNIKINDVPFLFWQSVTSVLWVYLGNWDCQNNR
jgi:hypothetical protein